MNSTRLFHPLALTSRQESEKNDIATTCWFVAYEVASGRSLLLLMFGAVLAFLLSFARHNTLTQLLLERIMTATATPKNVTRGQLNQTTPRTPEKTPEKWPARPSLFTALLRALSALTV